MSEFNWLAKKSMELNSLVVCERAFHSLITDGRNELK